MSFLELAEKRYSCRKFSKRPVERELIDKILASAIAAPTAVNTQGFHLWLLESDEAKARIRQLTDYSFGADYFLLLGAKPGTSWTRSCDGKDFSEVDAAIVGTHIMLEIYDLGLATTWVGSFDVSGLKAVYPQMEGYDLIGLFPFGYAAADAEPSAAHTTRKNRDDLVETL